MVDNTLGVCCDRSRLFLRMPIADASSSEFTAILMLEQVTRVLRTLK
jgi:hypothetical protein